MLLIGEILISDDLFEESFACQLDKCKGACCVEGDIGAPVLVEEKQIMDKIFPDVKPYLRPEGIKAIEEQGTCVKEGADFYTTLVDGKECAFVIFENDIALCGIEKAWKEGKINFQKPISCHLYPIRITKTNYMTALNYDRWDICKTACTAGKKLGIPVFRFLKDAIIREWGIDFYEQMDTYYNQIK